MEDDDVSMLQKHPFVTKEEFDEIRKVAQYPFFLETTFHSIIEFLDEKRKNEKIVGREAISTGPLVHLLSAQVHPDRNKPLTVSGRIYLEFRDPTYGTPIVHELFSQSYDDPQVLGPSSYLVLTTPDYSYPPIRTCMSSHNPKLVVDVDVGGEKVIGEILCCIDMEKVNQEYVYGSFGSSLVLRYASIPFAVYGRVEVLFIRKREYSFDENDTHLLDVKGKIVARYCNTHGRFDAEECTLFEKEFERVKINRESCMENMKLARSWIAAPVYSSIIIDLDLLEWGTERTLLKEKVEVPVKNESSCGKKIIVDDEYVIAIYVDWFSPRPQGRRCTDDMMELEDESSDDDDEMMFPKESSKEECDEQIDKCISGVASNSLGRQWFLRPHQTMPSSSSAMEIFSLFVGREHFKPCRVYGCIEVLSDAFKFQLFKKEANDALELSHDGKILSLLDGPREFDDCYSLEIKVDLKDVESGLHIKGYVEWDQRHLDFGSSWLDEQVCSVVQSQHGFAAIHYSFFSQAVQATIGFFCTAKKNGHVDVYPKFYGSIVARYGSYDYTSRYNKDYYQIVIFQRNQENPEQVQLDFDGLIPLSRSKVVVPLNSSLVIEANLKNDVSTQVLTDYVEFSIGSRNHQKMTVEGDGYSIEFEIHVKWDEVSH